MHAYRKFVQDEMDARGWTAAELERKSGLKKQNISRILRDERVLLQQRPDASTVTGLAKAFRLSEDVVLTYVAEAMGLPTSRVVIQSSTALTDDELVRVLAERLRDRSASDVSPNESSVPDDPDARIPREPQPDGATTELDARASGVDTNPDGSEADANAYLLQRRSTNTGPTKADYGRAAMAGTSDLERLDADAAERGEGSQDPEDWA